jgi:hypothetical protein
VAVTSQNFKTDWVDEYSSAHGLAGDPVTEKQPRSHEAGGVYYQPGMFTSYIQGQVMEVEVTTSTNHKGRFGLRICNVSGGYDTAPEREAEELTEDCFDENILVQANVHKAQRRGERFYYMGMGDPEWSTYRAYYQLPEDLVCDGVDSHCVLQWYWMTFHRCESANAPEKYTRGLVRCEDHDADPPYPEEFWNVADILILPPGSPRKSPASSYAIRDWAYDDSVRL